MDNETRFMNLKKKLDAFHYYQPITMDSCALVERVLNDLIKTTEGFQQLKKVNSQLETAAQDAKKLVQPLKRENEKLTSENNQLHYQAIKTNEEAEFTKNKLDAQIRSIEGLNSDLKFKLKQNETVLKKHDSESQVMKKKAETVIQKLQSQHQAVGAKQVTLTSALTTETINYLKSIVQGMPKGNEENDKNSMNGAQNSDFDNNFEVKQQLSHLNEQLSAISNQKAVLEEQLSHFQIQISNRDQEIFRLQSRLGLNADSTQQMKRIQTTFEQEEGEKKVSNLNTQIDFLNQQNQKQSEQIMNFEKEMERSKRSREENLRLEKLNLELVGQTERLQRAIGDKEEYFENCQRKLQADANRAVDEASFEKAECDKQIQICKDLQRQITTLEVELQHYQQNSNVNVQCVSAYQSDKKAFQDTISQLQAQKAQFEDKLAVFSKTIREKDSEINDLKVVSSKREADLSHQSYAKVLTECKKIEEEKSQSNIQKTHLEHQIIQLNKQIADLQDEMDRQNVAKCHVEKQLEKFKTDTYKFQAENSTVEMTKQRYQTLYESAVQDNDHLKNDLKALQELLQSKQIICQEEQQKSQEYYTQTQIMANQIVSIQKEHQITAEELAKQKAELRFIETQKAELAREVDSFKHQQNVQSMDTMSHKKLLQQIQQLEEDRIKANKQRLDQELNMKQQAERIKEQDSRMAILAQEKQQLVQKVAQCTDDQHSLSHTASLLMQKDSESQSHHALIQMLKEKEAKQISQIETLQLELNRCQSIIQNGQRQLEQVARQKQELMGQMKDMHAELQSTKTNQFETQTVSMQTQEKTATLMLQINDLKDTLQKENKKQDNLIQEMNQLQNELRVSRSDGFDKEEQLKQLRSLVEALERTREELLLRVQQHNHEKRGEEDMFTHVQKELQNTQKLNAQHVQEIAETRQALLKVDRDRDHMQDLLDQKTEENEMNLKRINQYEMEFGTLKEKCGKLQAMHEQSMSRVQQMQGEINQLQGQLQHVTQQYEAIKYNLEQKDKEGMSLNTDLSMVVRENQEINVQLQHAQQINCTLNDDLQKTRQNMVHAGQQLRACELERNDILEQYKSVCIENQRLERSCLDLSQQNIGIVQTNREGGMENDHLRKQLIEFEKQNAQLFQEIATYERQLHMLNGRMEEMDRCNRSLAQEKNGMQSKIEHIVKFQGDVEMSREEQQRHFIQLETEKYQLQETIQQVTLQKDQIYSQYQQQQQQIHTLEQILSRERETQLEQQRCIAQIQHGAIAQSNLNNQYNNNNTKQTLDSLQNSVNKSQDYFFKSDDIILNGYQPSSSNQLLNQHNVKHNKNQHKLLQFQHSDIKQQPSEGVQSVRGEDTNEYIVPANNNNHHPNDNNHIKSKVAMAPNFGKSQDSNSQFNNKYLLQADEEQENSLTALQSQNNYDSGTLTAEQLKEKLLSLRRDYQQGVGSSGVHQNK